MISAYGKNTSKEMSMGLLPECGLAMWATIHGKVTLRTYGLCSQPLHKLTYWHNLATHILKRHYASNQWPPLHQQTLAKYFKKYVFLEATPPPDFGNKNQDPLNSFLQKTWKMTRKEYPIYIYIYIYIYIFPRYVPCIFPCVFLNLWSEE